MRPIFLFLFLVAGAGLGTAILGVRRILRSGTTAANHTTPPSTRRR